MKSIILKSINRWIEDVEYTSSYFGKLKLPYNKIAQGGHRIVFDLDNGYVIKVATTLTGIKNCKIEARIYKIVPKSLRKHLSKVKEYGYGWVVMKKIKKQVPQTKKNSKKVIRILKKLIKNGIEPNDIVYKKKRVKWRNIRLGKNGKIIIIDYGHFYILPSNSEGESSSS